MRIVTAEEMRRLDRYAIEQIGIPSIVLMESAGRSVFAEIARVEGNLAGKDVGVICGTGNNGGDGFVVARYLVLHGANVAVWVVGDARRKKGDAETNRKILEKMGIRPILIRTPSDLKKQSSAFDRWNVVVDALFGTGLARPLKGVHVAVIEAINAFRGSVYSVDVPSGLHSDTGKEMGVAVRATSTITFGCKKRGFFLGEGPTVCGKVAVADISLDDAWADLVGVQPLFETEMQDVKSWFPKRRVDSHKGSFGHLLVLAGSPTKSGAAVLTSKAALRAGAGLVTLAVPESAHSIVKSQLVEVMSEPIVDDGEGGLSGSALSDLLRVCQGKDLLVVGPGLIPSKSLRALLRDLFRQSSMPIVLDADGLNVFGKEIVSLGPILKRMILTPHPGEMGRLIGKTNRDVQEDRIGIASNFSQKNGCHLVLKGAHTVIASPTGDTHINPTGNPGMATAGMGDVLSGVIGSFVAQGLSLEHAAIAGAYYHGWAGDRVAERRGGRGLVASDLIDEFPALSI